MVRDLYKAFERIGSMPSEGKSFNVESIEGTGHKIGSSPEGYPMLFVNTKDKDTIVENFNAELLSVKYNVSCSIVEEGIKHDNVFFSIITLRSKEEELQMIFIEFFRLMLIETGDNITTNELALRIDALMEIFSALKRNPVKELQGLWAEMLMIDISSDPTTFAKAWHSQPKSKYDFTKGQDILEVKSTSSEERTHSFALDQLNPIDGLQVIIASVIVRESAEDDDGLSVLGLYNRICEKIDDTDVKVHVYNVMCKTLGKSYDKANSMFFDYKGAVGSIKFCSCEDIPKIKKEDVPPMVSKVHFFSNLDGVTDVREDPNKHIDSEFFNSVF